MSGLSIDNELFQKTVQGFEAGDWIVVKLLTDRGWDLAWASRSSASLAERVLAEQARR